MDIKRYIGETTEYDKKQEVERRKVKSWLKSVCAFANGVGGCLIFGIADDDSVVGIADAKGDSEFISQKIKERINVTQNDTQNVTQNVTQNDLDKWLIRSILKNPQITTKELAIKSGKTVRTVRRHLASIPNIRYIGSSRSGHWEVEPNV